MRLILKTCSKHFILSLFQLHTHPNNTKLLSQTAFQCHLLPHQQQEHQTCLEVHKTTTNNRDTSRLEDPSSCDASRDLEDCDSFNQSAQLPRVTTMITCPRQVTNPSCITCPSAVHTARTPPVTRECCRGPWSP